MGKKAKAKQVRREAEDKKTTKKDKKALVPKIEAPKLLTTKKFKFKKEKIYGGLLTLIMLTLLVYVGNFLFTTAIKATPVAKYLPAASTVLLFELNTDPNHNQSRHGNELLPVDDKYSIGEFLEYVEGATGLKYDDWAGRQGAVAIVNGAEELNIYVFIEARNKAVTEEIVKDNPNVAFLGDYLAIATGENALQELLTAQEGDKLSASSRYKDVARNLAFQRLGLIYFDIDKADNRFFQKFPWLGERGISVEVAAPFANLFDAEGASLVANETNLKLESFLRLDEELLNTIDPITRSVRYSANLADYVRAEPLIFWGGRDLENQLKRIMEILAGGNQATLLVFDSIISNYSEKYFGPDINFKNDILPLFSNEFAFAMEKINDQRNYKLLIEGANAIKVHELAGSFAATGAIFEPKVVEYILEDGTVSKEIVAVPEEITKSESTYNDHLIYELKLGQGGSGIYYTITDDLTIITNNLEALHQTLDLTQETSFSATPAFLESVAPLVNESDEVSYFNVAELLPDFDLISTISAGRNYKNDGIATTSYITIKK